MLWLWVLLRVVSNPVANALQKALAGRGVRPLVVVAVTHALLTAVCWPWCRASVSQLPRSFVHDMAVCAGLAVASNTLLVEAVRRSDLSLLGPVGAWKPVVSLIPGVLLLGEAPGLAALGGVALVAAGSQVLGTGQETASSRSPIMRLLADRGVQFRVAAMALSAVEAVFLKRALRVATPEATFAWWAAAGLIVAGLTGAALAVSGRDTATSRDANDERTVPSQGRVLAASGALCVGVAVATGLMQYATLVILADFPVGPALALFQTSALLSVWLGHRFFDERDVGRRLSGTALMVVGAVLVVLGR